MEAKVFSIKGEEIKDITLSDEVFGADVSDSAIYYTINGELANRRVGTASVKNRKKVRGSNAKPWRQKGTGHARAGDRKSPLWVGGGTAFGPQPRDYHVRLPKKVKRSAMRSILTKKVQAEALKVVEDFTVETGKTKDLVSILSKLAHTRRTIFVYHEDDTMLKRAGRNIPWLRMMAYNRLSAHELYYGQSVIMSETAAQKLGEFYSKSVRSKGEAK
jgi:large subunit ribosomal protein L4